MSIRRVSDLPSLTESDWDQDRFRKSFLEVSYLSSESPNPQKYESVKVPVGDVVANVAQMSYWNPNLSGDLLVNHVSGESEYDHNEYVGIFNFGKGLSVNTGLCSSNFNGINADSISAADISAVNVYTTNG